MQNTHEIAVLRTMLRDVNVEYSALLRSKGPDGRLGRMAELKTHRLALMSRISGLEQTRRADPVGVVSDRWPWAGNMGGPLSAAGHAITGAAVTLRRYWAAWIGGGAREGKAA